MKKALNFQLIFSLAIIFFALSESVLAKETWLKIDSQNFQIVGNTDENTLKNIANKFENFHSNFQKSFVQFKFQTPFQTKIIVFQDEQSLAKFQKKDDRFIFGDDANYIAISADSKQNSSEIFRQYVKFLISNNLGQRYIPTWLNEALASYFANNLPNNSLLSQQNNLLSISNLLETNYYDLEKQPLERKAIFSAESLAFLNFLLIEKSNGKFENIEKLIQILRSEKTYREALISVFQLNFANLENEFALFLKRQKNFSNPIFEQNISVEFKAKAISEAESLAYLGDYFYYANRPKEAVEMLETALQIEPQNSLALSTLALIKVKEFYYDEAENLAQKAIEVESKNYLNQYRFAKILSRRGMTEFGFVAGYNLALAEKMRDLLNQAIELNPTFTESYALLTFVNYVRNEDLDNSLQTIKKALAVAPENQKYLLRLAEIKLRKESFLEARKLTLAVSASTESEKLRLYAQNTLQRIDSTEYQLSRIRNEKVKYANEDIVTEKPLSEEEIKRLREIANLDQIRAVLRRPKTEETRVLASLDKIECGQKKIDFIFKTSAGNLKLQAKNLDDVSLVSFIEEMSDFRLNCGNIGKENNASIIFAKEKDFKTIGKIISIEFVPKGFKLKN